MKTIEVRSAGKTDVGKQRPDNQDYFLVAELNRSMKVLSGAGRFEAETQLRGAAQAHVFAVADGMGGHRGGGQASSFAIEFCANSILNWTSPLDHSGESNEAEFLEDLKTMLDSAHRAVEEQSKTNSSFAGMGTTLTLAYVAWPRMFIIHAGDTRCYLFRDGKLQLVTRDHTVANEMLQKGQLAPEDLERSQWSNVLVNALGAGASGVIPDIYKLDLLCNDSVLLCSDGLNKHVSDQQIQVALNQTTEPQRACDELVAMAVQGGGTDNITVVIANFGASPKRNRMPLILTRHSADQIVQEVDLPASELDTQELQKESHNGLKDTCEFN